MPRETFDECYEERLWRYRPGRVSLIRASGATVVTFEDCTFEAGPALRVDGNLTVTGAGILLGAPSAPPQYAQGMTRGHWRGAVAPWGGYGR